MYPLRRESYCLRLPPGNSAREAAYGRWQWVNGAIPDHVQWPRSWGLLGSSAHCVAAGCSSVSGLTRPLEPFSACLVVGRGWRRDLIACQFPRGCPYGFAADRQLDGWCLTLFGAARRLKGLRCYLRHGVEPKASAGFAWSHGARCRPACSRPAGMTIPHRANSTKPYRGVQCR